MGILTEKQKKRVLITSTVYVTLIVLSIVFLFIRGLADLRDIYILNITADIFGMAMGYLLFVCTIIDVQKTGVSHRYFLYLLNTVIFGLFTDACAWLVNYMPQLRWLNLIDNTCYYMCAPIAAYFFWLYTMTYLKLEDKIIKTLGKLVQAGLLIALLLIIINLFTGIYFTVDASGAYQREKYYIVSTIYGLFVMLSALAAVIVERKQLELHQAVTLFLYALAPIAISLLTIAVYGLSIGYAVLMLVMLLMYCLLNVSQGRKKAVVDRELHLASTIQSRMLPRTFPYLPDRHEFDIYAAMTPAKEVGGDFYDLFMVDDDHIALVIADVSGKGIPAALFMMVAKGLIRNRLIYGDSPGTALANVNAQLMDGNTSSMFVTVWAALIELSTGRGIAVNAGHEHPAISRSYGNYELIQYRHSPALAVVEGASFKEREFQMNKGDTIFVYTDGVAEATNDDDVLFGTDRMLAALNRETFTMPKESIDRVMNSIDEFVEGAKQFDDITMLCFRYFGRQS